LLPSPLRWRDSIRSRAIGRVPGIEISVAELDAVCLDWPRDVLNLLITQLLEGEAQLVQHLIADNLAYTDFSWIGKRLQSRRDIMRSPKMSSPAMAMSPTLPHCTSTAQCTAVDHTCEFHQQPVACGLKNAPMVFEDLGLEERMHV
jgi:hypothetical protein